MRNNVVVTWYTWLFDGVGGAAAISVATWGLGRITRSYRNRTRAPLSPRATTLPNTPVSPTDGRASQESQSPAPPTATSPGPSSGTHLVDLLLDIPGMSDPDFRRTLYEGIPATVVHQVRMSAQARIELIDLIDTFGQYPQLDPWQALLDRLRVLLPEQATVRRLADKLAAEGLLRNPGQSAGRS